MRPASRILLVLLSVLIVAMGLTHLSHSHTPDEVAAFHPACTLCQFHTPAATAGDGVVHGKKPDTGAPFLAEVAATSPITGQTRLHASRAPPLLLVA
jgi:uncharacterized membrane protein YgdD (TMEM256/DUF423 family)